ncbi:DUF488 domain-containing protein [Nocardia callitridis]|uniref:DUF488 family protein n=1 Tax=Nocardia callitridis TaxID=648753 RepID=A0ABP9K2C4_9NOCA
MTARPAVRVRRIYEEPAADDGARVLVDRIWPRGVSKAAAKLDEWCRQIAPSTQLRQWYGHDPDRFAEFTARYHRELADTEHAQALDRLRDTAVERGLTLLTATKDPGISAAAVLAELLGAASGVER